MRIPSSRLSVVFFSVLTLVLAACQRNTTPNPASQRNATLSNGTLTATVSATGNIQPESEVKISFQTAGTVSEVNVKVGDNVKKGDVLAKLDTTDLELALMQAQASLEQAKNSLANADTSIAQAENQILIATAAYSKTVNGVRSTDVAAALASFNAAQTNFDKVKAGPTQEDIASADAALKNAEAALKQAQSAYDRVATFNPAGIGGSPQALQLEQATNNFNSAKAQYDKVAKGADSAQLAAAQQQLAGARATLEKTRQPVLKFDIDQAQAQITNAELQLKNARTQKANSETQLKLAELQVKQAQRRLDQTTLLAPLDGTVSQVLIDAGEAASVQPVITMVDESKYHIDITVDEIDIAKIKVNQEVDVTLDSLPGVTVKGTVDRISPTSTTVNGVVSYLVRVLVSKTNEAQLRAGMTANASIVLEKRDNILLAPNWAIRRDRNNGKTFLTFKEGDKTNEVEVKLGLKNDTSSEIVSGAKAGDVVVAPTTPNFLGQ